MRDVNGPVMAPVLSFLAHCYDGTKDVRCVWVDYEEFCLHVICVQYCGVGMDVHVCFVGTEMCCGPVVVA